MINILLASLAAGIFIAAVIDKKLNRNNFELPSMWEDSCQ